MSDWLDDSSGPSLWEIAVNAIAAAWFTCSIDREGRLTVSKARGYYLDAPP